MPFATGLLLPIPETVRDGRLRPTPEKSRNRACRGSNGLGGPTVNRRWRPVAIIRPLASDHDARLRGRLATDGPSLRSSVAETRKRPGDAIPRSPENAGEWPGYFRELLIDENMPLMLLPIPLTIAMIASEIPAAINPYSMAVAPVWSRQNLKAKVFIYPALPLLGAEDAAHSLR